MSNNSRKFPDILKRSVERGLEAGLGSLMKSEGVIKGVLAEGKLPKEVTGFVLSQLEDTKDALLGIISKEIRSFLSTKDVSAEIRKTLSEMSLQITTEIRFNSLSEKEEVPSATLHKTQISLNKRRKPENTQKK